MSMQWRGVGSVRDAGLTSPMSYFLRALSVLLLAAAGFWVTFVSYPPSMLVVAPGWRQALWGWLLLVGGVMASVGHFLSNGWLRQGGLLVAAISLLVYCTVLLIYVDRMTVGPYLLIVYGLVVTISRAVEIQTAIRDRRTMRAVATKVEQARRGSEG